MEPFSIRIELASLDVDKFAAIDALVTDRTTHSGFPRSFLNSLGIVPNDRNGQFILQNGERRRFDMGPCRVRFKDRTIYHDVVFLDDEMPPQIGFVTLGEFALEIDPAGEPKLVPTELRMPSIRR
jgi:hypothetical protein